MMTRTVDLVIVGADAGAVAATIDAVRRGLRVLIVIRSTRASAAARLRQALRSAHLPRTRNITITTGAEVVCVDGVNGVEAVVVRDLRTRRLIGFNAAAVLRFSEHVRK